MNIIKILTSVLMAGALSACAPTRAEYDATRTLLSGSPKIKAQWIAECVAKPRSTEWVKDMSDFMNVPKSAVKTTFCNRLYGALASGRMTYDDLKSVWAPTITPNLIRIIQGR